MYFRAHSPVLNSEVTHNLANWALMGTEIHPVQDQWQGKKGTPCGHGSTKNLCYFQVVSPIEYPKIMGLKGFHSPEALKCQAGLSLCPWCGKEGQNEGTIVNHFCTEHYPLGLVCKRCLQHFMTSSDRMQQHLQGCKSAHVCNDKKSDWSHQCYPQN